MAPNLYVCVRKAISPWTWHRAIKPRGESNKLYYSQEPVPGIYAKNKNGRRYLVALKVKRGKDALHLFVPRQKQHWMEEELYNSPEEFLSKTLKRAGAPLSINSVSTSKADARESESTTSTAPVSRSQSVESGSIQSLDTTLTYIELNNTEDKKIDLEYNEMKSDHNRSSSSDSKASKNSKTTIITATCEPVRRPSIILCTSPGLKFQDRTTTLRSQKRCTGLLSNPTNRAARAHGNISGGIGIVHIDMNGYRFLERPVRVKYCAILERWLFASEIKERTIVVDMCESLGCTEPDPANCRKCRMVEKSFFCLDDGFSWVGLSRGQQSVLKKQSMRLYCVDEEFECMRRMTIEEEEERHRVLLKSSDDSEPRILAGEVNEPDYMAVMRYLDRVIEPEVRGRTGSRDERRGGLIVE